MWPHLLTAVLFFGCSKQMLHFLSTTSSLLYVLVEDVVAFDVDGQAVSISRIGIVNCYKS